MYSTICTTLLCLISSFSQPVIYTEISPNKYKLNTMHTSVICAKDSNLFFKCSKNLRQADNEGFPFQNYLNSFPKTFVP